MTNAAKLAALPRGGTNCSAPLAHLNERAAKGDMMVYVSDNESWLDAPGADAGNRNDGRMESVQGAKSACPAGMHRPAAVRNTQAAERDDILNVGGFSDQVFETVAEFAAGRLGGDLWVSTIESIEI